MRTLLKTYICITLICMDSLLAGGKAKSSQEDLSYEMQAKTNHYPLGLRSIGGSDPVSVDHCYPYSDEDLIEILDLWKGGSRLHKKIAGSMILSLQNRKARLKVFVLCRDSDSAPITMGLFELSEGNVITLTNVISNPALHMGGIRAALKYVIKRGLLSGRSKVALRALHPTLNSMYLHLGFKKVYIQGLRNYFEMDKDEMGRFSSEFLPFL